MSDVQTFNEGRMSPSATPATPAAETPAPAPAPAAPPSEAPPPDNRNAPALDKSPSQQIRDAARALAQRRRDLRAQAAAAPQEPAAPPETQSPLPQVGDAAQETGPSETQEVDPAAPAVEEPSIKPPRSWMKEHKAAFEALPREVQQQVAESERARETDFLQRQHAVAEQHRAYEAQLGQMAQVRQQYEQGLQSALQMTLTGNEFGDIRSMEDVEALAVNDWPRWVRFQTHQQKVQMLQNQLGEVQQQNYQEAATQWNRFAEVQDQQFAEKYPDAKALKDAAVEYLTNEAGFERSEIARYWNTPAWRDTRMQGIILDAVRYRQAKAKADAAVKKPVPEVQKPGVSAPKMNAFQAQISDLESKGSLTLREAARLNQMRRMARSK